MHELPLRADFRLTGSRVAFRTTQGACYDRTNRRRQNAARAHTALVALPVSADRRCWRLCDQIEACWRRPLPGRNRRRHLEVATVCLSTTTSDDRPPHDPGQRGVVAVILRGEKMLVIRRSSQVRAPRTICFPGGGIRDGEDEPTALVRECREEIGVEVRLIRRLWECETAWGVRLGWWLAEIDAEAKPTAAPAEVEEILWLRPVEMASHPDCLASNRVFLSLIGNGEISLE